MVAIMHRRLVISALACWPARHLLAQEDAQPRQKISAAQLHQALAARFPLRIGVEGLLAMQVSAPRLHLLPARNRIGAALLAELSGSQLRQPQAGEMDVAFGLRYEAADRSVRARDPEILDLRWPGLAPDFVDSLRSLLPAMTRDALGELVLHRFTPRELALPDTMGFEPQRLEVVEDGLLVLFGPKSHP